MTQKELLYIDDALGHEKAMQTAFENFSTELKDPELKTFVSGLAMKHGQCYARFLSLLG